MIKGFLTGIAFVTVIAVIVACFVFACLALGYLGGISIVAGLIILGFTLEGAFPNER